MIPVFLHMEFLLSTDESELRHHFEAKLAIDHHKCLSAIAELQFRRRAHTMST